MLQEKDLTNGLYLKNNLVRQFISIDNVYIFGVFSQWNLWRLKHMYPYYLYITQLIFPFL